MGAKLSLNNHKRTHSDLSEAPQTQPRKRQKTSSPSAFHDETPRLIPILPDEISLQILARLPRTHYLKAKLVSRTWKSALTSTELHSLRKALGTTEEWIYALFKHEGDSLVWHALDPVAATWQRLPPMPNSCPAQTGPRSSLIRLRFWNIVNSSIIAGIIRGWLGKRNSLEEIPFCGCSIGAVGGSLYVVGGFSRALAVTSVWRYSPVSNSWGEVAPMLAGRAYCKTGVLNGKLYVVGGVTRGRGGLTPLHSAEVYDPETGVWAEIPSMPFSKAQLLPPVFLADLLKPIATGMTSYKGKLYVPQSLYCWPFFIDVGGEVFDPETGLWAEMPVGMGEGWPAKQAGTKLSVVVDGELYALEPLGSIECGRVKVYDFGEDSWKTVEGDLPIRDMNDSESPYLLASVLGKLHVITKDANRDILVLQADRRQGAVGPSTAYGSMWRVIATKRCGSAELVSCQILDV